MIPYLSPAQKKKDTIKEDKTMEPTIFWGNILRSLREKRNLTQKEVAAMLHVSRQAYSGYETGRIHPSPEIIAILSEIYNIDMLSYVFAMFPQSFVEETSEYRRKIAEGNNTRPTDENNKPRKGKGAIYGDMGFDNLGI